MREGGHLNFFIGSTFSFVRDFIKLSLAQVVVVSAFVVSVTNDWIHTTTITGYTIMNSDIRLARERMREGGHLNFFIGSTFSFVRDFIKLSLAQVVVMSAFGVSVTNDWIHTTTITGYTMMNW